MASPPRTEAAIGWRARHRNNAIGLSVTHLASRDIVTLTATCRSLRAVVHDNAAVADAAFSRLAFAGPYPFGVPSCVSAFAHGGRMKVPRVLETILVRHGARVRAFAANDCLFHDACLSLVTRYCTALTAINLSNSEHRFELNAPLLPSCLTAASLVLLQHNPRLTRLELQHTHVSALLVLWVCVSGCGCMYIGDIFWDE